jgi:hypothetical protein
MLDNETKPASPTKPKGGEAPATAKPTEPAPKKAAAPKGRDVRFRSPDEWAVETGRKRVARIVTMVNGSAQKDRQFAGEHTAAARLHCWGRSDVVTREITREAYEAAITATKRAPEGGSSPVPHPDALFASIYPTAHAASAKG